jgi:hypothetical protein
VLAEVVRDARPRSLAFVVAAPFTDIAQLVQSELEADLYAPRRAMPTLLFYYEPPHGVPARSHDPLLPACSALRHARRRPLRRAALALPPA